MYGGLGAFWRGLEGLYAERLQGFLRGLYIIIKKYARKWMISRLFRLCVPIIVRAAEYDYTR